jgi:hypothetical protein
MNETDTMIKMIIIMTIMMMVKMILTIKDPWEPDVIKIFSGDDNTPPSRREMKLDTLHCI